MIKRTFLFCINILILLLLVSGIALSQSEKVIFEHISTNNNLFHFSVNSIFQDKSGFLWFGTRIGLNLYDGKKFTVFKTNTSDSSISNELIRVIYETRDGELWIGTEYGLNRYDRFNKIFYRFLPDSNKGCFLADGKIIGLAEDREGNLWIATQRGISVFDIKDKKIINVSEQVISGNLLNSNCVYSIVSDGDGNIIIGYIDLRIDLLVFGKNNPVIKNNSVNISEIKRFSIEGSGKKDYISKVFIDSKKRCWIGTYGSGLFSIEMKHLAEASKEKLNILPVEKYSGNSIKNKNISNKFITDIAEDEHGNLWIGTFGGGLNYYNRSNESFTYFRTDSKNSSSISSDYIKSVYIDKASNLWVGTYTGGLEKYSSLKNKFNVYKNVPDDESSLKSNLITAIFQDKDGILWIGTRTGLNKFDRKKSKCDLFVYGSKELVNDPSNLIRAICEDNNKRLWIGTHAGIQGFDKMRNRFIPLPNKSLSEILVKTAIRALLFEGGNILWIGTDNGLYRYDLQKNDYKVYVHSAADSMTLSHNYIWDLYQDNLGDVWIGTREGLNRYLPDSDKIKRYLFKTDKKHYSQKNFITSISSDIDNVIWIGTYTGGLNRLDPKNDNTGKPSYDESGLTEFQLGSFKELSIGGIMVDKSQNLWIGTDDGIFKLNRNRTDYHLFELTDHVSSNELNTGSVFKGNDDELFFGGNNGLISFYPQKIKYNEAIPNIVLTSFKKMNNEIYSGSQAAEIKEIHLSYSDNNFSFTFSSLDYTDPQKNQYRYKLEGYDQDWIDAGNKNEVSYMNLQGGDYIFRVVGSNNDKIWNEKGLSIKIIISPPFWETWWFRILVVLALVTAVYFLFRLRLRRIEKQKAKLERLVAIRTFDLKNANIRLEKEINERKRAEEEIVRTNELLAESNLTKDKLFSIISHDLRSSIGSFMSMLKLLVEEPEIVEEKELREILVNMEESAESTYNLLENLLGWAKSQRGVIEITPEEAEINLVVDEVFSVLSHISKSKKIQLSSKITEPVFAYFDHNSITIVIRNLVSNALKFTKANGNVWIEADNSDDKFITVSIKDDGVGIAPERISKIFNAFQGETTLGTKGEKGTGLGLLLCKEFVEKNGGTIWVESEVGKGSSFKFTLPKVKV